MRFLISLLINGLAVYITDLLLPGVHTAGYTTSILVAVVLALINTFIKPILTLLTLPITVLTLGIFYFVLNALLILLVDRLITGFTVDGILWALLFGLVLSIVNWFFSQLMRDNS